MESTTLHVSIQHLSNQLHEPINNIESLNQWQANMFSQIKLIAQLKLSSASSNELTNASLDPSDWAAARNTAHAMLDSSLDHIQFIRESPVWRRMPSDVQMTLENEPLPEDGQSLAEIHHDVVTNVIPYAKGNSHPRYWGWVTGASTLGGVLADMLSATLNINTCDGANCAASIERTVMEWVRQLFDFPSETSSGFVTSGTSMSTVICLATARQRSLTQVRQRGLRHEPQLIAYGSTETHGCVVKALELLGLGSDAMHYIGVDANFSVNIDELKATIEDDRKKGLIPFCIIGNAGTVNTGAFDQLRELASIARSENLWFHVDGAFGSLIILDPQRRQLVEGIQDADSLAFDFHKWFHCPYDAGCVLVRDGNSLRATFAKQQSYLAQPGRVCTGDRPSYFDLGPELSRSFRALKVWFTFREHGTKKLGQAIANNCLQAQYLVSLLEKHEDTIRILRPVSLNIVNFRFEPDALDPSNQELVNRFNSDLLDAMQLSGIALPSSTSINGRFYIRVCIANHRSTLADVKIFVEALLTMYQSRASNRDTRSSIDA